MKYLLLLFIVGCKTTVPVVEVTEKTQMNSTSEIKNLDFRLLYLEYNQKVKMCFVDLEICRLKRVKETVCWSVHERCVIDETNNFNKLLKKRGH